MPSLSPTAAKVINLASNINSSPAELTRVIKLDPVLSAKVLRLVNSSYFSLSDKVVSLEKAVIMVGLNTVKNLALSAAILATVDGPGRKYMFDAEAFWMHSLGVGVAAKFIAGKRGVEKNQIEDYFLAGMLHDIGLLVESLIYPEEFRRVLLTCRSLGLITMEEAEMDGLNHCFVGKALGEKWGLPGELLGVLAHHHAPPTEGDGANPDMIMTLYLANIICENNDVGLVLDDTPITVMPEIYSRLNIDESIEAELMQIIDSEIKKAMEFLRV